MPDYMRCNSCGTVGPGDLSLTATCPNASCGAGGSFTAIGAWGGELGARQDSYTTGAPTDIRVLAKRLVDTKCTQIKGVISVNYKSASGKILPKEDFQERELNKALERIANGQAMPVDVANNTHHNDGAIYKNKEGILPVRDANYYVELGVLVGSRGWEVRVSSERLVVGRCWDLYYTSLHYDAASWWVFNTVDGHWRPYSN